MEYLTENRSQQEGSAADNARVTLPTFLHEMVLENTIVGVSYMIDRRGRFGKKPDLENST